MAILDGCCAGAAVFLIVIGLFWSFGPDEPLVKTSDIA